MNRVSTCLITMFLLLSAFSLTAAADGSQIPQRLALSSATDSIISPYTGYTRQHWIEIAGKIVAGFLPCFSPETGMPDFRGADAESGHFQYTTGFTGESRNGFGRTMLLASLYCAATGTNKVPGFEGTANGPYLTGMIRGTDPNDPAYWGPTGPFGAFGNQLAQAIMYCPEYFWDPLTKEQQDRLAAWFRILVEGVGFECNCWYFNTGPVPVLERYGYDYDYDHITEQMARMQSWHSGDGFFIDGGNRSWDYYNFWGFQMFNLYHYRYTGKWQQKFGAQIRETTGKFMEHFPWFFGSDGAPMPFGRSLTYRVAASCPVGYAEIAGLGTLDPGMERRIASGTLKYFWEGGMLSPNGLLQVGWHGPNAIVGETYIHRGTPYWASVGFIQLLLPEDHPFWTSPEKAMPADNTDGTHVVTGSQMVFRTNSERGESRMYPIGSPRHNNLSWQTGVKYFQHAYSTDLGWAALGEQGPELSAGRSGVSTDGKNWVYRTQPAPIYITERHNADYWMADLGDKGYARIVTQTLIGKKGAVHAVYHTYPEPLYMRAAGFGIAVPHGDKPSQKTAPDGKNMRVNSKKFESVLSMLSAPDGKLETVHVSPREGWNHSHLFGGTGAWPQWTSSKKVPPRTLVIFYADGAREEKIELPEFEVFKDRLEEGLWVRFEDVQNLLEVF